MDFTPLSSPHKIFDKDVARFAATYGMLSYWRTGCVATPAIIGVFALFGDVSAMTKLMIGMWLAIGAAVGYVVIVIIVRFMALRVFPLLLWARANSLVYVPRYTKHYNDKQLTTTNRSSDIGILPVPTESSLLRNGSASIAHTLGDKDFSLFEYSYTVGSGKNKRTVYWHVGCSRLNRKLPHVLLNNKDSIFSDKRLPLLPDSSQIVTTEASFSDRFTTYAPDGYTIDVLSFLAPDIMLQLTRDYSMYDIEIIDDLLLLYNGGPLLPKNVESLYTKLDSLKKALHDNVDTYKDSHLSSDHTDSTTRAAIDLSGQRLKRSVFGTSMSRATTILRILAMLIYMYFMFR